MTLSFSRTIALAVAIISVSQFAGAQATRTWVSGVGDDINPGSRTAPCKTFAGAFSKTAAGGEIDVIDAGGFGSLTITKAITIDGKGPMAGVLVVATNGLTVNAAATDTITIRNLCINGVNASYGSLDGIHLIAGGTLILENVTIYGFQNGVGVAQSADSRVIMKNVTISNCSQAGVSATTTAGNAYLDLENLKVCGCATGVDGVNGARVTMKNCNLSMNTNGVIIKSSGISSRALLNGCIITNTTNGITVGPGTSLCRMSDCTISNNLVGIVSNSGATLSSAGNNTITGNGTDGPTPPVYALK